MLGRTDLEASTCWDFPTQSDGHLKAGDAAFNGVTPARCAENLVRRYARPGDLVVDPMAGSGTIGDVARSLGRRAISFDLTPKRSDILRADARAWPIPDGMAALAVIDSPYSDNLAYGRDPRCLGRISCRDSRFYDDRLGLREVEHGANGGVDERHVAGDCSGPSRTDSSGGLASPGPDRGACGAVLDFLAESETRSGVRGGPSFARAGAGVHPARSSRPAGRQRTRTARPSDPRLGMVPLSDRGVVAGQRRAGGPAHRSIIRARRASREWSARTSRDARRARPLISPGLWRSAFTTLVGRCTSGRIRKSRG